MIDFKQLFNKNKNLVKFVVLFVGVLLFGVSAFFTKVFKVSELYNLFQILVFFLLMALAVYLIKIKRNNIESLIKKLETIKFSKYYVYVFYFIISLLSLYRILLSPGTIGLRDDWVIPPYNKQVLEWAFEEQESWLSQGVGTVTVYPSQYLSKFVLGGLSFLFKLNGELLTKFYLIFLMNLIAWGGFSLAKRLRLDTGSAFLSGLFYMLTPVIFNRIIPGYITYLLSYALLPFILSLFIKFSKNGLKVKEVLFLGLITSLGITHVNFMVLIPLFLFVYSLFEWDLKKVVRKTFYIILIMLVAGLLHLNWLIPLFSDFGTTNEILVSRQNTWVELFNPPITNVMLLFGATYGFFTEVTQVNMGLFLLWTLSALCLIFLVFFPLVSNPKNKIILRMGLVNLLFLFLAKGRSPPFGSIFAFLYNSIPLLTVFRDVHNLLVIPCLCYSILLGYAVVELRKYIKKYKKIIPFSIVFLTILVFCFPFFTGNFGGFLQTYQPHESYKTLYDNFNEDVEDYRILWLPPVQPVKYAGSDFPGLDPMITYSPKDSLHQLIGFDLIENSYTGKLDKLFHENITTNISLILNFARIKYVIFRNDVVSKLQNYIYMHRYPQVLNDYNNKKILDVLESQNNMIPITEGFQIASNFIPISVFDRFTVYEVGNDNFERISIPEKSYLITGGYDQLVELIDSGEITNTDNIFFASQLNSLEGLETVIDEIFIEDNLGIVTSSIPEKYKISPGKSTFQGDINFGWSPYYSWWWYDWTLASQIENGAVVNTIKGLDIELDIEESGDYVFLIKNFFYNNEVNNTDFNSSIDETKINIIVISNFEEEFNWPSINNVILEKGEYDNSIESILTIYIDEMEISTIITGNSEEGFKWSYLTDIFLEKGEHILTIFSKNGMNAVSRLILVPKNIFVESEEKTNDFMESFNKQEGTNSISVEKVSNTLYNLDINSSSPFILVFSESYNKDWALSNQDTVFNHFLCNSFANCYVINKTGEYTATLYFERQEHFSLGQKVSLVFLIISIIYLLGAYFYEKVQNS